MAVTPQNTGEISVHQLERIQPSGPIIAINLDWIISFASHDAADLIAPSLADITDQKLSGLLPQKIIHTIAQTLQFMTVAPEGMVSYTFAILLFGDDRKFDIAIYNHADLFIIEIEPTAVSEA